MLKPAEKTSLEGITLTERPPARSAALDLHEGDLENFEQPETAGARRLLLGLAHKLHDNETALSLMRNVFRMFQRIGITVGPNHYYWPVPDLRQLESRKWPPEEQPVGLDLRFDHQLEFLETVVPRYQSEWESASAPFFSLRYNYGNGFFEAVDAEIAYCMVRHYKPRRIVEVGAVSAAESWRRP